MGGKFDEKGYLDLLKENKNKKNLVAPFDIDNENIINQIEKTNFEMDKNATSTANKISELKLKLPDMYGTPVSIDTKAMVENGVEVAENMYHITYTDGTVKIVFGNKFMDAVNNGKKYGKIARYKKGKHKGEYIIKNKGEVKKGKTIKRTTVTHNNISIPEPKIISDERNSRDSMKKQLYNELSGYREHYKKQNIVIEKIRKNRWKVTGKVLGEAVLFVATDGAATLIGKVATRLYYAKRGTAAAKVITKTINGIKYTFKRANKKVKKGIGALYIKVTLSKTPKIIPKKIVPKQILKPKYLESLKVTKERVKEIVKNHILKVSKGDNGNFTGVHSIKAITKKTENFVDGDVIFAKKHVLTNHPYEADLLIFKQSEYNNRVGAIRAFLRRKELPKNKDKVLKWTKKYPCEITEQLGFVKKKSTFFSDAMGKTEIENELVSALNDLRKINETTFIGVSSTKKMYTFFINPKKGMDSIVPRLYQ